MAAGTVAFAAQVAGKPVVVIRLPDGRRVTYEPVHASLPVGAAVEIGTVIGTVTPRGGHCGTAIGCVHLGLRRDGVYLDPTQLLGRRPAVLKPW